VVLDGDAVALDGRGLERTARQVLSQPPALVWATWGLVFATALLFLTAAIPAVRALLEPRARKRETAVRLVPDMHILRSRIDGGIDRLEEIAQTPDRQKLDWQLDNVSEEQGMVAELLDVASPAGMRFTNELYICRHLLTQARFELLRSQRLENEPAPTPDEIRERDESVARAAILYVATRETLDAAEETLPAWTRDIDGEPFWDRFKRLAREREASGERKRLEDRQARRP